MPDIKMSKPDVEAALDTTGAPLDVEAALADLSWTKPDIDDARAAAARGDVVSMDEAIADIDMHIALLRKWRSRTLTDHR
jgi:hypothetical protein